MGELYLTFARVTDESTQNYQLSAVTLSGFPSVTVISEKLRTSYLVFTGCRLNENKLRDMLHECVPVTQRHLISSWHGNKVENVE